MKYEIGIIGAGPSGLFAGINLNKEAIIFERKSECGKKLLASGSGKCNFTHSGSLQDFVQKYGNKSKFVKNALKRFSNKDFLKLLDDNNYMYDMREDGKYFPRSYSARDFRDFLLKKNIDKGNLLKLDTEIVDIKKEDGYFKVFTSNQAYEFKYIIVASGGKSYPQTGSDGKLFSILENMGHSIISPKPALSPAYIKDFDISDLMGLSFENISAEIWRAGKKLLQCKGDLLITHFGLSGPLILDNSRYMASGDSIKINFLNEYDRNSFEKYILEYVSENSRKLAVNLIRSLNIQKRLADRLLEIAEIPSDKKISELTKNERKKIVECFTEKSFEVKKIGDFNIAMATAGGISTEELNSKSFESKIIENLFIAGEAMDVDGDTGGYNIQWGFTSGFLAAEEINKRLNGIDN